MGVPSNIPVPIVFDYANFVALFPEYSGVGQTPATSYFNLATMFVRNCGWPVSDPALLSNLLYLTTAHLIYILSQRTQGVPTSGGAEGPTGIVGRINSATEGSVSVSAEMPNQPPGAAWWQQSPYGALVWQLLKPFRLFRYVPGPRRMYNPPIWGYGRVGPGIR